MKVSEHPAARAPGVQPRMPADPLDRQIVDEASITTPHQEPQPQATIEPIDTAPQDGREIHVLYGEDDTDGRVVRWRSGRRFSGRRWIPGGRWAPSDSMQPLPGEQPSHWLRPPGFDDDVIDDEPAAA